MLKVNTYDILNAGPKNRFLCDGRIVSNSGRLVQLQNLPRQTLKSEAIAIGIDAIKGHRADLFTDDVMGLCSNLIRSTLIAAPGHKLVVSDLSNIEGRVLAWIAGEQWKLDAFARYDQGKGDDLYKLAYAKAFRVPPNTVDDYQRQLGKVLELSMGYAGGVGAFNTFATAFRIDLEELAEIATIPPEVWDASTWAYEWILTDKRPTYDLTPRVWLTCDSLKRLWRQAHPAIVQLWRDVEEACINAITSPGEYGTLRFQAQRQKAWLRIRLSSGRYLSYPGIKLNAEGKITFKGINQFNRKWNNITTFGGKLCENLTQALSRDILTHGMQLAEQAGYRIVLTVHDEIVSEVPDTQDYSAEGLSACMATVPEWASGLPLAAKGYEAERYKK